MISKSQLHNPLAIGPRERVHLVWVDRRENDRIAAGAETTTDNGGALLRWAISKNGRPNTKIWLVIGQSSGYNLTILADRVCVPDLTDWIDWQSGAFRRRYARC